MARESSVLVLPRLTSELITGAIRFTSRPQESSIPSPWRTTFSSFYVCGDQYHITFYNSKFCYPDLYVITLFHHKVNNIVSYKYWLRHKLNLFFLNEMIILIVYLYCQEQAVRHYLEAPYYLLVQYPNFVPCHHLEVPRPTKKRSYAKRVILGNLPSELCHSNKYLIIT